MAAGLYLLLMWGYIELPTPQLFAVFSALIMCVALLFWVSEARAVDRLTRTLDAQEGGKWMQVQYDATRELDINLYSYSGSVARLDALRDELAAQYAQFGRDQSARNLKGLGAWHRKGANGDGSGQ